MGQVRPRAAVVSTVGALGIAASAYFDWGSAGAAETIPLQRLLFASEVSSGPAYWQSMAAPLVIVGAIGVLGALLLNRVILLIAVLLGMTTAGLWVATEVLESEAGFGLDSVLVGGWVLLGAVLVLLAGLIGLRRRADAEEDEDDEITPFSPGPRSSSAFFDDDEQGSTRIGPRSSSDPNGPGGPGPGGFGGPGGPGAPGPAEPPPTVPQPSRQDPPPSAYGPAPSAPAPRDQRPADPF